ncbi:uncharacterized protein G2W53_011946 [Senna tora]|uniref:Uncharacterized protein n=1 Tax=Senna tora TaxID=362788 RepID=A0A834TWA1_9FABA|nr:uncharacterized protein G2W53_011946 [Senna tora]
MDHDVAEQVTRRLRDEETACWEEKERKDGERRVRECRVAFYPAQKSCKKMEAKVNENEN